MSAFTEKCWRLAGTDVTDPVELDQIFKELERLRGEARTWPELQKKAAGELEREESESNRLRILLKQSNERERELSAAATDSGLLRAELQRYRLREELHIKPLFDAVTGCLAFAGTPEAESAESLQKRVDRAVAYKVSGRGDAVDTAKELERARVENDQFRKAVEQAEGRVRWSEHQVRELERLRKANKVLGEAIGVWESVIADMEPSGE